MAFAADLESRDKKSSQSHRMNDAKVRTSHSKRKASRGSSASTTQQRTEPQSSSEPDTSWEDFKPNGAFVRSPNQDISVDLRAVGSWVDPTDASARDNPLNGTEYSNQHRARRLENDLIATGGWVLPSQSNHHSGPSASTYFATPSQLANPRGDGRQVNQEQTPLTRWIQDDGPWNEVEALSLRSASNMHKTE